MPKGKTKFQPSWLAKTDGNGHKLSEWCRSAEGDVYRAFCILCQKDFACDVTGVEQIMCHAAGKKHTTLANAKFDSHQKHLSSESVPVQSEVPKPKAKSTVFQTPSEAEHQIMSEMLWCMKMVQENWSFTSAGDNIGELFSRMFPKYPFSMSRTKAAYLISDGIGPYFKKQFINEICKTHAMFTIEFDETTTARRKKQMDILIRYFSKAENAVVVRFLTAVEFGHAKAVDITRAIIDSLTEPGFQLPIRNLFYVSSDGPNVNKAVWRNINEELKVQYNLPGLLPFIPCNLHAVNNAFRHGLKEYGSDVETFVIDLYYYFQQSQSAACRREDFQEVLQDMDLENRFFLRHVQSRWLTLGPAVERVLANMAPVQEFFLNRLPKETSSRSLENDKRYQSICRMLKDKNLVTKLKFVASFAQLFQPFLLHFQVEMPAIHILHEECNNLIKTVMRRFLAPTIIPSNLEKVTKEFLNKSSNQLPNSEINIGSTSDISDLERRKIKACYINTTLYLIQHLPVENQLLKDLAVLHPLAKDSANGPRAIRRLALALPQVVIESEIDALVDEWNIYANETIDEKVFIESETQDKTVYRRVDHYWADVLLLKNANGDCKYTLLAKLIKCLLACSHGNADCERSLSDNKNLISDERTSMSLQTIIGCRIVKSHLRDKRLSKLDMPKDLIKAGLCAARNYRVRLEKEKEDREKKAKCKKEENASAKVQTEIAEKLSQDKESIEKKAKKVAEKESAILNRIQVAEKFLKDGSERLNKGIQSNDKVEMSVAQSMLEIGGSKLSEAKNLFEDCSRQRQGIDNRKRKLIEKLEKFSYKPTKIQK